MCAGGASSAPTGRSGYAPPLPCRGGLVLGAGPDTPRLTRSAGPQLIECDECVWCTSAGAQTWLRETGLALDAGGFVRVSPTLESVNSPGVFAVGDVCAIDGHPRPKAGVFAVRGGPPLARNLRQRLLRGADALLEEWVPQEAFLGIIGTGRPDECVASRGGMGLEGAWLWGLKDWIDRTWMAGYTTRLPKMLPAAESLPAVAHTAGVPRRPKNPAGLFAALRTAPQRQSRALPPGGARSEQMAPIKPTAPREA